MGNAAVWRTNFTDASVADVFEDGLTETAISKSDFADLKAAMKSVPRGALRVMYVMERIEKLNPDESSSEFTGNQALEKGGWVWHGGEGKYYTEDDINSAFRREVKKAHESEPRFSPLYIGQGQASDPDQRLGSAKTRRDGERNASCEARGKGRAARSRQDAKQQPRARRAAAQR